jgi:hypothetical protein
MDIRHVILFVSVIQAAAYYLSTPQINQKLSTVGRPRPELQMGEPIQSEQDDSALSRTISTEDDNDDQDLGRDDILSMQASGPVNTVPEVSNSESTTGPTYWINEDESVPAVTPQSRSISDEPIPEKQDFYLSFEKSALSGEAPVGLYATALKKKQIKTLDNGTKLVKSFHDDATQMTHRVTTGKNARTIRSFLDNIKNLNDQQLDQLASSNRAVDYWLTLGPASSDLFSQKFMSTGKKAIAARKEILAGLREAVRQNGNDLHISNQFPDKYMNLIRNWLVVETDRTVGGHKTTRYRNSTAHMAKGGQEAALENIKHFANRINEIDAQQKPKSSKFSYQFPVTKYKGCITSFTNGLEGKSPGKYSLNGSMQKALDQFNADKPASEQIIFVQAPAVVAKLGDSMEDHNNEQILDELAFQNERYQAIRKEIVGEKPELTEVDFEKDMRRLYANQQDFSVDAMKEKWGMHNTLSDDGLVAMASYATKRAQYELAQSKRFHKKHGRNAHMFKVAMTTDLLNEIYEHRSSEGCKSNKDRGAMVMTLSMALDECAAESANWNLTDPVEAEESMRELQISHPEFFCEASRLDDLVHEYNQLSDQISQSDTTTDQANLVEQHGTLGKKIKVKHYLMICDHFKAINAAQYHTAISGINAPGANGVKSQGEHNPEIGNMQNDLLKGPRQMMPSVMAQHYRLMSPDFLARKNIENALADMNKRADHKMLDNARSWYREAKEARESYLELENKAVDKQLANRIFNDIGLDLGTNLSLLGLMQSRDDFEHKAGLLYENLPLEQRKEMIEFQLQGARTTSREIGKAEFIAQCHQLQASYPEMLSGLINEYYNDQAARTQVIKRLVKYVIDTDPVLIDQPLETFKTAMEEIGSKGNHADVLHEGLKYRAFRLREQAYRQGAKQVEKGYKKCLQRDAIAKYGIKNYDMNNPLHEALFEDLQEKSISTFKDLMTLEKIGIKSDILDQVIEAVHSAQAPETTLSQEDKQAFMLRELLLVKKEIGEKVNNAQRDEIKFSQDHTTTAELMKIIEPDQPTRIGLRTRMMQEGHKLEDIPYQMAINKIRMLASSKNRSNQSAVEEMIVGLPLSRRDDSKPEESVWMRQYPEDGYQRVEALWALYREQCQDKPISTKSKEHKLNQELEDKLSTFKSRGNIVSRLMGRNESAEQKTKNKQDKTVIEAYQRAIGLGCPIDEVGMVIDNAEIKSYQKLSATLDEIAANQVGLSTSYQDMTAQGSALINEKWINSMAEDARTPIQAAYRNADEKLRGKILECIDANANAEPMAAHRAINMVLVNNLAKDFITKSRGQRLITAYNQVKETMSPVELTTILNQRVMRRNIRNQLEIHAKKARITISDADNIKLDKKTLEKAKGDSLEVKSDELRSQEGKRPTDI